MKLLIVIFCTCLIFIGLAFYHKEGPEKPVVHHMKGGFICITYRETMICGQGTNTRPSQSDTSPDETLSVTYSIPLVPSYSTEF